MLFSLLTHVFLFFADMFPITYFSRSWVQCLESKVIPVLARVTALLDTCANLNLLDNLLPMDDQASTPVDEGNTRSIDPSMWIELAWLNILQDDRICMDSNEELSTDGELLLHEFCVACPAAGNVPFVCRLPFPWIVWDVVSKAIVQAKSAPGGKQKWI
jgi:hypothetical protein